MSRANGFKDTLEASPGCEVASLDFGGIEAVMTGWFANDPVYMRLATLGVHSYVTTNYIHEFVDKTFQPADLKWSDEDLDGYFTATKKDFPKPYKACKVVVHSTNYGAVPFGIYSNQPEVFGSVKNAELIQNFYFDIAPLIKQYQKDTIFLAAKYHYLGGWDGPSKHPYGYKFSFWDVENFKYLKQGEGASWRAAGKKVVEMNGTEFGVTLGKDAKAAIGCRPQSTAAGKIKAAAVELGVPGEENYIGDVYYGKTPLRAMIHDEFWLEYPKEKRDYVLTRAVKAMTRPIATMPCPPEWGVGSFLKLGVSVKVGQDYGKGLIDVTKDYYSKLGETATDVYREGEEEDGEE